MQPDWNTQAGQALAALAGAIRRKGIVLDSPILVFGSAPLQMSIDRSLLSGDVDITVYDHTEVIKSLIDEIGLGKGRADFFIEVVPSYVFRPGVNWSARATLIVVDGVRFLFPAALDILLAKLRRLESKDIKAFLSVKAKTGQPTEAELVAELRASYDMFYIQKNGAKSGLWENTEKLWPILFGKTIDPLAEIVNPVLAELSQTSDPNYVEQIKAQLGL